MPRLPAAPEGAARPSAATRHPAPGPRHYRRPQPLPPPPPGLSGPDPIRIVHDDIQTVLFDEQQIVAGIDRVAADVTAAYDGADFTVVGVLKGSCIFVSDLVRRIPIPLELAFLAASSYRDGTTSGDLELNFFPAEHEIEGRRLLLVDDILDTGRTMYALKAEMLRRGAAEVRTCAFLDKPARRAVDLNADYRVFEIDDLFVVGYGLDYAGRYRNLPYVGALKPELYSAEV